LLRVLLVSLLAAVILSCGQPDLRPPVATIADEEYAVLSAVLKSYVGGSARLVVHDVTASCDNPEFPATPCSELDAGRTNGYDEFPRVPSDADADFRARNATAYRLEDRFTVGVAVTLLSDEDLDAIGAAGAFWPEFHATYGDDTGLLYLSRVGFNAAMDLAVVDVGHWYGSLGGEGMLYQLRKRGGTWVETASMPTWIS
jgi:hypothetical protein